MDNNKSLDEVKLIAALLHDVQTSHGVVFNKKALRLTLKKVSSRVSSEGFGFLSKTMPRLGKALDRALSENKQLDSASLGFKTQDGSKLPRFLGELFNCVLQPNGAPLRVPCVECIKSLRQVLYLFYKYETSYTDELEQEVVQKFIKTDAELLTYRGRFQEIESYLSKCTGSRRHRSQTNDPSVVAREARILLSRVFASFDPTDIRPKHGPGVVATKQQLWSKYKWTNICRRITAKYPLDAYFYASLGHFCDDINTLSSIKEEESPAKVILVPKDSRGPRLISCEPVDFQWIQQGLGRAIVNLVEQHSLTRENVRFTDQQPNRFGALVGSKAGKYATLDLNEASDRVSVDLVRLLFPEHVYTYLEACRSLSTVLPDGRNLPLNKFAPMGSCLCFPVLSLVVWSILTAGVRDADTRDSIYVYGDDVIVPTAYAANAIERLESFGLKINRDKSCTSGFFRESCGMDAYLGTDVTPVRLRTVWSSTRTPESYSSWIAYANSFYYRGYYSIYDYIVEKLHAVYGAIPSTDMNLSCPSLVEVALDKRPKRRRVNKSLQKLEYHVFDIKAPSIVKEMSGWSMLLRFFVETSPHLPPSIDSGGSSGSYDPIKPFSVRVYTRPRTSLLVRRWR